MFQKVWKKMKRHFIVSALNILKWVFSELICCTIMEKKTLRLYSKVALRSSALCALAFHIWFVFYILQSSESAGGCCNPSVCVGSLLYPTFYRKEHILMCRGWERCSRLGQQVASRLWRLPGHDLGHGPCLSLWWSTEKHWVLVAESITAHMDT